MAPTPAAVVRRWAKENGFPVGDRGRLSPEVLAAFAAAHEGAQPVGPAAPVSAASAGGRLLPPGAQRTASGYSVVARRA